VRRHGETRPEALKLEAQRAEVGSGFLGERRS